MLKPEKLLTELIASGTGASKIVAARAWLDRNPKATSLQLVDAMMRKKLWPEGTIDKAAKMLGVTITDDGVREDDGMVEEVPEPETGGPGPKWKRPAPKKAAPKKAAPKTEEAPEI